MIKEKKIKLPSTGGEISEMEFGKRIDQVKHILNSVVHGSKAELFGSKKFVGWCNQRDKVVGYKLALCKLSDDENQRRKEANNEIK